MIEVLKFRWSLLRERLSIRSWHNILSFFLLVLGALALVKLGLGLIGSYRAVASIILILFCCLCGELIFAKNVKNKVLIIQLFFSKVPAYPYKLYLTYRNYIYVQLFFIFVTFPLHPADIPYFSLIFTLFQGYLLVLILVRRYGRPETLNKLIWNTALVLSLLVFAYIRFKPFDLNDIRISRNLTLVLFALGIILAVLGIDKIEAAQESRRSYQIRAVPRLPFLSSNKDFLYVLRSNVLRDPIIVILTSGCISYAMKESRPEVYITSLFSFTYALSELYFSLLKYENKGFVSFYTANQIPAFKKEKIRNTLSICIPVMAVTALPISLFSSAIAVYAALLSSVVIFWADARLFKLSIERKRGYKCIVSDKDYIKFILLYAIELTLLTILSAV